MRIQIAQAQQGLEKQHGRGPNCGTAAKPWQDLFAQQGLNLKQQKSTGEYRQRKRQETPRIGSLIFWGMGRDHALTGGSQLICVSFSGPLSLEEPFAGRSDGSYQTSNFKLQTRPNCR